MKIILWDIETSPIKAYTWGLFPKSIHHDNIIEDFKILCVAWKELGSKKAESVTIFDSGKKDDDLNVVKKVHEVLSDADIIVGHNGDKFDLKRSTTTP